MNTDYGLKACIVEDEEQAARALRSLLVKTCPEMDVVGTWSTVPGAVSGILEKQPDVVFLDVQLGDNALGFEVLEKFPQRSFEVIFVTAYNKYAVRAFHFSATHYLEKPVDALLLREAVERVKKKRSGDELRAQLQVLSESLRNLTIHPRQVILPNPKEGDSIVVPLQDVIRVEASGSYAVFLILWKGTIEKSVYSLNIGTLQKKMLQGHDDFIMIHESHIINRNHITHYNPKNHSVRMTDNAFIKIAERRLRDFLTRFNRV